MKKCRKCKKVLPKSYFYKNISSPDGLYIYCKECAKIRAQNRRTETPPKELQQKTSKPWTFKDVEYLIEYRDISALELAYALERSVGSIYTKKSQLKKEGRI